MNEVKQFAVEVIDRLHQDNRMDYGDYSAIHDGLDDIELLRDRDERLEELWEEFGDVPMDPETECIEAPFMGWGPGINREEIWHWFDRRHSKGIAYLLYRTPADRTPEAAKLLYLKQLCIECEAHNCAFNPKGICLYPFVGERKPELNDDGCVDFCYMEE